MQNKLKGKVFTAQDMKTLKEKINNFIFNYPKTTAILLAAGWVIWGYYA